MGNSQNKNNQKIVPQKGYRILSIDKVSMAQKADLSLLTDFIISPHPRNIDLEQSNVDLQIYSILDSSLRVVNVEIQDKKLGICVRHEEINECIFRITHIFQGSPLEKHHVCVNQFIVGILQAQYSNLNNFAQAIKKICGQNRKTISIGICGEDGKTRVIQLTLKELNEWKKTGRGLLGCELAEGWINRWKKPVKKETELKDLQVKSIKQIPIQVVNSPPLQQQDSCSSEEVQNKCNELMDGYQSGSVFQLRFKGILKNQSLQDASSICKCKPLNRFCQICYIEKNDTYFFFNKKTNKVIGISGNMMLKSNQNTI